MGVLTYLKIGAVVVILAVCGFYVYNYQHMKGQIVKLEEKIAGLELRAEIIEKAQRATDAFIAKKTTVQRKAANEKSEIDQTVQAGDNAHLRELSTAHGLLKPKSTGPSPSRPTIRPRNLPR